VIEATPVRRSPPKIVVGAFDQFRGRANDARESALEGEVLVGALTNISTRTEGGAYVGTLGPTDTFTQISRPYRPNQKATDRRTLDVPARLLSTPKVSYSQEARRMKITGEVLLEVELRATGAVHVRSVLAGLGHGLDEAAIFAVNQTRCLPAVRAGQAITVIATISVVFQLA
jgi:TonB family protein